MRSYLTTDLEWLEPIAKHHDDWRNLLAALTMGKWAAVEEPYCIAILYYDDCGLRFEGLTDKEGIKPFIRLCRATAEAAKKEKTWVHSHWDEGSWEAKLGRQMGFVKNGHGYYTLNGTEK